MGINRPEIPNDSGPLRFEFYDESEDILGLTEFSAAKSHYQLKTNAQYVAGDISVSSISKASKQEVR